MKGCCLAAFLFIVLQLLVNFLPGEELFIFNKHAHIRKMKKFIWSVLIASIVLPIKLFAQDTTVVKLNLKIPVFEYPDNIQIPHIYPTMNQAHKYSFSLYDYGFYRIDATGNKLFNDKTSSKLSNKVFKYLVGFAFSYWGSELPIPLGVWAHEEYHRSVLGINDIKSKNGNWIFTKWNGTVFGVSDSSLSDLKQNRIDNLLYAYTAGIQYHADLTREISTNDFYNTRSNYKNPLLLYNAYYIYNYFRYSASKDTDADKIAIAEKESANPLDRDFAGNDITAWIYDMFNPELPYTSREVFPQGNGVNRRIGISDLSPDAQDYLKQQKDLSLLNFINPAVFLINRIKVNEQFSFNFFTQYVPVHFGNSIALYVPFKLSNRDFLVQLNRYSSYVNQSYGIGVGYSGIELSDRVDVDVQVNYWKQPQSFFSSQTISGGLLSATWHYGLTDKINGVASFTGKTKGWVLGEPDIDHSLSLHLGVEMKW